MTPIERATLAEEVSKQLLYLHQQQREKPTETEAARLRDTAIAYVAERRDIAQATVRAAFDAFDDTAPLRPKKRGRPRANLDHAVVHADAVAHILQLEHGWSYRAAMEAVETIFKVRHGKIDAYRSARKSSPLTCDIVHPQPIGIEAIRVQAAWALLERCTERGTPTAELRSAIAQINAPGREFPLRQILARASLVK
jgi:hypothetical protein